MKRISYILFLLPLFLSAQTPESAVCTNPNAQINLDGNGLRARLLGAGDFGWDLSDASYIPNYSLGTTPVSTIFLGGLWYGGIDPAGNLLLKATDYRSNGMTSFYAGPLDPTTGTTDQFVCNNWDRFFRVTATEINDFLADLADGTLDGTHTSIRGWPGRGNPFFSSVTGFDLPFTNQALAPFHDEDGDGDYNPMKGDYPVVRLQGMNEFVPDQQIWQVVNDEGGGAVDPVTLGLPLHAEIQITYFAFNCPGNPLLHNAMFSSHKLINYATSPVDSFSLAMYVDFDLGCYQDDYVGCNPATGTFYAYNQSNTDKSTATCNGVASFGVNPPVQAVTFLNKPFDRFIPIYNSSIGSPPAATTHPSTPLEFFRYLHGHWRDGMPLTFGGTGYSPGSSATPTTHAFPDAPYDPAGWSMKTANMPGRDQRGLAIHEVGTLMPGQILELHTAWSYHRGDSLDYLGNVALMLGEVPHLLDLYAGNFADVCTPFVSVHSPSAAEKVLVWPNPSRNKFSVRLPATGSGIARIFNQTGMLLATQQYNGTDLLNFDCAGWPKGTYFLQVLDEKGMFPPTILTVR